MHAAGTVLVLIWMVMVVVAIITIIRGRIDWLRLQSRKAGALLLVASLPIVVVAGLLLPKATPSHATASPSVARPTSAAPLSTVAGPKSTARVSTVLPTTIAPALPPAPDPLTVPVSTSAPVTARCTNADQASVSPSFDAEQFNASIAQPLSRDIAAYHAAVSSGDIGQIQESAGTLYSDVGSFEKLMSNGRFFGCWDENVLQSVSVSGNQLSSSMDALNIASAAAAPGLERSAAGPLHDYISAVGAYAGQFGGQHPQE